MNVLSYVCILFTYYTYYIYIYIIYYFIIYCRGKLFSINGKKFKASITTTKERI